MNPYKDEYAFTITKKFYDKFYSDNSKRIYIVGINPGRFGGGITDIPFTDPKNLEEKYGVKNDLKKRPELSSGFVYSVIDKLGGASEFYEKFFITALYPLALIKEGKNYNYYDSPELWEKLKPEILKTFKKQINFGAFNDVVIFWGKRTAGF